MTLKTQTSRRGMIVTTAAAVAAVLVAVGAAATMQDDDKAGAQAVEQAAPQNQTPQNQEPQSGTEAEAPADATPTFLATSDLRVSAEAKTWTEQPGTQSGVPDPEYTCIKGLLPVVSTMYKSWSGDMTAEARQFVSVAQDADVAQALVKSLNSAIANCSDNVEDAVAYDRHGQYPDVAGGLTVHGVYFEPQNSEYHLQLFGVGRDGKAVIVTTLGQMGREGEAPVDAFTATAKTAVEKVY